MKDQPKPLTPAVLNMIMQFQSASVSLDEMFSVIPPQAGLSKIDEASLRNSEEMDEFLTSDEESGMKVLNEDAYVEKVLSDPDLARMLIRVGIGYTYMRNVFNKAMIAILSQSSIVTLLLPPDIFNQEEGAYDDLLVKTFEELGYVISQTKVPVSVDSNPEVKH